MSTATAAATAPHPEMNGTHNPNPNSKPNAWQSPGPAAFDFRSPSLLPQNSPSTPHLTSPYLSPVHLH